MRRRIAPYPTRVVFDYSKIYGPGDTLGPYFVCMGESDVELVVKLMEYARRRINWAENLTTSGAYYNGLTDSEWESLTDALDDLEGRLMAVICQQDIIDAIAALTACVCQHTEFVQRQLSELPDITPYIDEGTVTVKTESETQGTPTPPATDPERCEYAQAVYYQVYEAYTEYLFPYADQASDVLLAALVASAGFTALAGFVGLPVSIVGAIIGYVVDMAIDSSIANFTNWMQANKDELICELYKGLPDFAAAASNVRAYVDSATEISYLDKQLLNQMIGGEWWIKWVIQDQETNGTWDDYLIPGQCDDCEPSEWTCEVVVPCVETDWFSGAPPVCHDGKPRCSPSAGIIRHIGGTLVPTATDGNRFKITVTGDGGVDPINWGASLYLPHTGGSFPVLVGQTVDPGETKTVEGTFSTVYPGEVHQLQVSNSPWFLYVEEYCIADPE